MKTAFFKNFMIMLLSSMVFLFSACERPEATNPNPDNSQDSIQDTIPEPPVINVDKSKLKLIGYCGNNIDINIKR